MRIAKTIPLSLALAGIASPALAMDQGDTYLGGGFGMVTYDEDGIEEVEPTVLLGRLGHFVADNIAIEGRLGFGIGDDSVNVSGVNVDFEIDQVAGVYGVGHLPLADAFSVYGLAGFTYAEGSLSFVGLSFDDDDTDFSYGIGAQADVTDNVAGFIEWVQYLDESTYEVSAITIGANYTF